MIKVGDKVTFNNKYPDCEKYQGKEFTVRDVGTIGGEKVVWLQGLTGCYAADGLNLAAKLIEQKEQFAARIENGKITEMNVPVVKIKDGKVIEMNV